MIKLGKRILVMSLILLVFSQVKNAKAGTEQDSVIHILWSTPIRITDGSGFDRTVLHFEDAIYGSSIIPLKVLRVKGKVNSFSFQDLESEQLPSGEKAHIPQSFSSHEFSTSIQYGYERNELYSFIRINTVRANSTTGSIERLLSFKYHIIYGSAGDQVVAPSNPSGKSFRVASPQNFATSSVLVSGQWYKMSVRSSGIHKIDYETLKSSGINPDNIDPRKIRLFGNGGSLLPQKNSEPRHDDLTENAIQVVGEEDGKFDSGDYILFYAKGAHSWNFDTDLNRFVHSYNIYTESAFYFLTIGPSDGLRISGRPSLPTANHTVSSYNDYAFIEKDEVNILHSGREWYGDKFDYNTRSRNYSFSISSLVLNSPIILTASVMAASSLSTSFSVFLNNSNIGTVPVDGISNLFTYSYSYKGVDNTKSFTVNSNSGHSSGLNIRLTYNYGSVSSASGYLNYLEINCQRNLGLYGNQTSFRSLESINASSTEYVFSAVSPSATIWDITNPLVPEKQEFQPTGLGLSFKAESSILREFVIFTGSDFPKPVFSGLIRNQNLHSINSPVPDLLIVTADQFYQQAEKLAAHRRSYSGLRVYVAKVSEIYNEFGSGAPDITAIRDFVRMVYQRSDNQDSLKNLLIFGDCSYDYKDRVPNNTNHVPVYESRQSLSPVGTYSSDDYFGFLDTNEGDWLEPDTNVHLMDIGVGRLPVSNTTQGDIVVNKLINYDINPDSREKWRNKILFVADDGDNNLHQKDAERLSKKVFGSSPVFNINKIYLDAYPQIAAPGGEVAVEAKQLLNLEVEKGALIINYTGHGGVTGLSQERVLEIMDILSWTNKDKLTFMVTATCEFGRYDDPGFSSAAEEALRHEFGGAVGLMTTTRAVYSSSNFKINNALYSYILSKKNGDWRTVGEIMKLTKNNSIDFVNNRNYSLLGDPSQTLAYPKKEIIITSVNGKDPSAITDTLKALSKVTIAGEVREGGNLLSSFNGTLNATVFDKPSKVTTIGNERNSPSMTFDLFNNYVYDGKASVKDGRFSFSFIVPKDISYQLGNGKISVYAKDNSRTDAHGYESNIIVGGSADNVAADNIPPQIKLFMNDESFVNGGVTGKDANLLIKLHDENGINIAGSGIGHEITASIDDSKNILILNEFYSATLDNYQEGSIEYPVKDLAPGLHTVRVKAWDTHNNSNESYLEFIVLNDEQLGLRNILNYPNPFSTSTNFHFDHNRVGDDLEVMVQVFTVSGKLVTTLTETIPLAKSHISEIHWNGRDDFGDRIGKGVYVYKVEVRSIRDGSKTHKYQKLVILN